MKQLLRNALNVPRYGAVALDDPQELVDVRLEGSGPPRDVTRNQVVAALRPFTLGVMLPEEVPDSPAASLAFYHRGSPKLRGRLHLRPAGAVAMPGQRFGLFEVAACENYCVSRLQLAAYDVSERWRAGRRQRRHPHNFRMTDADLRASHVFYICPRPVVLVTVEHEGAGNMFPMDLIGPTDSPWFSMALRLTSPAVELMRQSRRLALTSVPYSWKDIAYKLGEHHRKPRIAWEELPFAVRPSAKFRLPVAGGALRVREVEVDECRTVGSHMLFLTRVVSDTPGEGAGERQLFHAFYGTRHQPV